MYGEGADMGEGEAEHEGEGDDGEEYGDLGEMTEEEYSQLLAAEQQRQAEAQEYD